MQAVVFEEFEEPLTIRGVDRAELDGVVADVTGCGVCRSDWCWRGHRDRFGYRPDQPYVVGPEPIGRVGASSSTIGDTEGGTGS